MTQPATRLLALTLLAATPAVATSSAPRQKSWTTGDGRVVDVAELEGHAVMDPAEAAEVLLDQLDLSSGAGVAVCATLEGEPLFASARGLADLEHDVAASVDTVFDMASVSKSLTAFAVAKLAEEARVPSGLDFLSGPLKRSRKSESLPGG